MTDEMIGFRSFQEASLHRHSPFFRIARHRTACLVDIHLVVAVGTQAGAVVETQLVAEVGIRPATVVGIRPVTVAGIRPVTVVGWYSADTHFPRVDHSDCWRFLALAQPATSSSCVLLDFQDSLSFQAPVFEDTCEASDP